MLPAVKRGIVVLGSPIGTAEFVEAFNGEKLAEQARLWKELPLLPDLQCAWVLLLMRCASRANFRICSQPPEQVALYAASHDTAMWQILSALVDRQDLSDVQFNAMIWAQLPLRMGGCGMRSALRSSPAAYWASVADTLPMMKTRSPNLAAAFLEQLLGSESPAPCLFCS